ncbi:type II toxin-antitoxin system HicA family toxin [Nocardiopsis changdeensis]|uniref:type II toxin-antitoxin system HicA family toxin n=1 Tax=Nocardiopsis changdeensis TaxID=2831969 RepID=UPI0015987041|nr:type II toxin-antitoxin system HicA family toxin [Nocardiopsis flavescens]
MKRRELLKRLREAAEQRGMALEFVRSGGRHDIYRVGDYRFPVGRHADIPELTALKTIKEVENL